MKITVAGMFKFALLTIISRDANSEIDIKQLEDTNTLKWRCARYMMQTLTNVCYRRHVPALILVLDNLMQVGIIEHHKIMDECCPSPCTADYMKENYCDYIKFTRSVNPSDALAKNPDKSTTEVITTASDYTEKYATSTEKSFLSYLFSRNPGYQILTLGPHWIHNHAISG